MTQLQEQEMYEYYKSLDYSNVTDWSVLFSTHKDFCDALHHTKHYFHEEAKQIKSNKDAQFARLNNHLNMLDARVQDSIDHYYANMPNWAK